MEVREEEASGLFWILVSFGLNVDPESSENGNPP
jgi:hypothetical protein